MVKVNENKSDLHGHDSMSSMLSDGSFVVLERTPPQESAGHFLHQVEQQPVEFPPFPENNFAGGPGRLESQVSQNMSLLPGSLSSDLSPEEIQKKLHELLQENLELKETLHQNNLAMKQQFATLAKWQDDVFNVFQNHKAKFAETKELVIKLRDENGELKRLVEECKQSDASATDSQLKMENVKLKVKIAELEQKIAAPVPRKDVCSLPTKKEVELSALLEQVNNQLETAERARRQLTLDVERLTAQRTRLERDMAAQKLEMEQQREQIQELTKQRDYKLSGQNGVDARVQNDVHTAQPSSQLVHQVEEQKMMIRKLAQELQDEKAKVAAMSAQGLPIPSSQDKSNMAYNMRNYEQALAHLSGCMDQEAVRLNSLDSWLQVAADNVSQWNCKQSVDMNTVATLRAEIQKLRNLLAQEQAYSQGKKQSLDDSQRKFHELFADYQKVMKELEKLHKDQKDKELHSSTYQEIQARGFTEKIDSMTAQLLNKEEALKQKNKEISQLIDKMKKLELENEAITILKAQVEVYQSDFNAEREARENLAGEKERLAEDLRHLQRYNQQLLDDLEAYQQNHFDQIQKQVPQTANGQNNTSGWNTIATPGRSTDRRSPARISPGRPPSAGSVSGSQQPAASPQLQADDTPPFRVNRPLPEYFCPKCEERFIDYRKLEDHVEECLEL